MSTSLRGIAAALIATLAALPLGAHATAAPVAADEQRFTDAELDRMLAPIALYPDTVLTHVLIASTYPLEVVEAARWSKRHPGLRGQDAVDEVASAEWAASVKALVAFPELLERMSEDLDWTEDLGNAFLAQESQVMDRVQVLRDHADEAGTLDDVENVRVVREAEVIHIEPVREVVYVPYYDTRVVFGAWWWPAYPPVYWAYWGGYPYAWYHTRYHTTFYWGIGWHRPDPWFWYCAPHWQSRRVVTVNHYHQRNHRYYGSSRQVSSHREARHWQHDTRHRRNVSYRQERVAREHGGTYRGESYRGSSRRGELHRGSSERRGSDRRDPRPDHDRGQRVERRRDEGGPRAERRAQPPEHRGPRTGRHESQRAPRAERAVREDRRTIEQPARDERRAGEQRTIERPARGPQRSEAPPQERREHQSRGHERGERESRGREDHGHDKQSHRSARQAP